MGRPRKPKNRCLDCLYEIDQRATRCMRCYRTHLQMPAYTAAESARKKRLKHYHTVIVNDPDKLEAHRAQAREGMQKLRDRRKQAKSTQVEDTARIPPRVV
jgi:hypothetical protein